MNWSLSDGFHWSSAESELNVDFTWLSAPVWPFSSESHSKPGGAGMKGPANVVNFWLKGGSGEIGSHDVGFGGNGKTRLIE